jgi:hypothetical protein
MARKPQPKRHKVTNRKPAFLAAFTKTLQLTAAAKASGVDLSTHYKWLKDDPQYCIDYEKARNDVAQRCEDVAIAHACDGVKKTLYYRGRPIHIGKTRTHAYVVEYDHSLLLNVLRRLRPDDWRERVDTHVTGSLDLVEFLHEGRKRLQEMKRDETDAVQ